MWGERAHWSYLQQDTDCVQVKTHILTEVPGLVSLAVALPWCVVIKHFSTVGFMGWLALSAALASPGALWLLLSKDMTPKYTWQTQGLSDGCPTLSVDCSQLKEREWSVNITQLLINLSLMCGGHITGIDIWVVREWICAVCVCVFGKFMVRLYVFITESHFICANLRKISN